MRIKYLMWVAIVSTATFVRGDANDDAANSELTTTNALARYAATDDYKNLLDAWRTVSRLEVAQKKFVLGQDGNPSPSERTFVSALRLVEALNSARDYQYDLRADHGLYRGGVLMPSDPEARKRVEEEDRINREGLKKQLREFEIQQALDGSMSYVRIVISNQPTGSERKKRIIELVNSTVKDAKLREALLVPWEPSFQRRWDKGGATNSPMLK